MEKETKMSSEIHVVKGAPEDVTNVSVKDVKGEKTKEDKVTEKQGTDTKDGEKAEKQVPIERSSSSSQRELYELQEKVKALELELNQELEKNKAAGLREREAMEKLKSAEERLEKQAIEIKRSIEIKDLHKHSDLSIQKAMKELNIIDTEAKSLTEKSKQMEERIRLYEDKLAEASEELDQSSLENELLLDTNNQLKIKIQELEGFQRDIEGSKDLVAKLQSHENLIEEHKKKVQEVSEVADTRQMELEKALLKLKTFEDTIKELEEENGSLAEVNLKLNQELANQGSETSGFQAMFSALEAEKDQAAKELQASKEAVEKLTNKLTSERETLRSQVDSVDEQAMKLHKELQASHTAIYEELEAKKSVIVHLESLLKDLEKSKETETMGKGEVQVKSRDIDVSFLTPKQCKSKEESDHASASHSSSSGNVATTQKAETSHLMTLKIVLGVALVSVIIGIILGKKY